MSPEPHHKENLARTQRPRVSWFSSTASRRQPLMLRLWSACSWQCAVELRVAQWQGICPAVWGPTACNQTMWTWSSYSSLLHVQICKNRNFFFLRFIELVHVCVSVWVCVRGRMRAHAYMCPRRSEKGVRSPGVRVIGNFKPCGHWELNASPLEKPQMLRTLSHLSSPSLHSLKTEPSCEVFLWPRTHEPSASASRQLGLKVYATICSLSIEGFLWAANKTD